MEGSCHQTCSSQGSGERNSAFFFFPPGVLEPPLSRHQLYCPGERPPEGCPAKCSGPITPVRTFIDTQQTDSTGSSGDPWGPQGLRSLLGPQEGPHSREALLHPSLRLPRGFSPASVVRVLRDTSECWDPGAASAWASRPWSSHLVGKVK